MSPLVLSLRFLGLVFEISLGPDEEAEEEPERGGASLASSVERISDGSDPAFGFGRHWWEEEA